MNTMQISKNKNIAHETKCHGDKYNKNKSSRKLFVCFQPVNMEGIGEANGGDTFINYIKLEKEDAVVLPQLVSDLSSSVSNREIITLSSDEKRNGHKKFKHFFKAVLLGTSLVKKTEKKKLVRKLSQSNDLDNKSPELANYANSKKQNPKNSIHQEQENKTSHSEIHNPTRRLSTSRMNLIKSKRKGEITTGSHKERNLNSGLCLILVSLIVLVFWGKAFAIVCTSTCLFFVPCWSSSRITFYKGVNGEKI